MDRVFFYDESKKFIGSRDLQPGEVIPQNATNAPVDVPVGKEAYFCGGAWVLSEIPPVPEIYGHELTENEILHAENAKLSDMLSQTNADFAGFMDYYFTANPE